MSEIFQKIKIPLIIVLALFLGFIGYVTFIKKDDTKPNTLGSGSTPLSSMPKSGATDQRILPVLTKVRDIKFDAAIFKDPVFISLEDFSQKIIPEDVGRDNPFSPSNVPSKVSEVEGLGFNEIPFSSTSSGALPPGSVRR